MLNETERWNYLVSEFDEAILDENWDDMESLLTLNPDIMEEGLRIVYPILPDEYRYSIPTHCYTHNGDRMPGIRGYVRQARKYAPIEKRIPAEMIALPEIQVYRAGEEPISKARYGISWTTSLDVARWFYDRAQDLHWPKRHLYKGTIKPEKIICYTNDRQEQEVMQYNNVKNIVEIER